MDDAQRLTDLRQRDTGGRVDVGNCPDVGSPGVDAGVDPQLGVGLAIACEFLPVKVEDKQTIGTGKGWAGAGREQEGVSAWDAGADVPESGHQAHAVHDAISQRDIFSELVSHRRADNVVSQLVRHRRDDRVRWQ